MIVEDHKLSSNTPLSALTNIRHGVRTPRPKWHGDSRDTLGVSFLIFVLHDVFTAVEETNVDSIDLGNHSCAS